MLYMQQKTLICRLCKHFDKSLFLGFRNGGVVSYIKSMILIIGSLSNMYTKHSSSK